MVVARAEEAVLGERVSQLEDRGEKWDSKLDELARNSAAQTAALARIEGSLDGAFKAKKLAGALLGVVLSVGSAALLGLLLFALKAKAGAP